MVEWDFQFSAIRGQRTGTRGHRDEEMRLGADKCSVDRETYAAAAHTA